MSPWRDGRCRDRGGSGEPGDTPPQPPGRRPHRGVRFDAGTAELIADDIDIAVAVDRCLRVRNWTNVDTDVPPGLTVPLDRRRFDVVVANLVGNALRHGSAPVSLRASIEPDEEGGKELVVEVRDHGQGLAPAAAARVLDRFYKTDSARARSEGSGLGLAIAQENARLHGGRIDAGNHPGGGAVFTMRLPAHRPWRDGAATPQDILAVGDAQPSASNMVTAAVSSAFALLWVLLAVLILAMVVCWVMAPAVAAAAIAFPAAIYLHALTVESIGTITGSGVPASATTIYRPTELLVLAASGLVIAAGALLPASWAGVSETTTALHAE